ncbi:enoyl-CoA hydratase/isomerase family protein [Flocculibacter collagenilyticus]|uniref:enoyl-CoA hydratase/isomerase family protein n=1 Tax=Flocculibacter collagenilyticus TaxID=2744479 RepID=UPI0018F439FC|nr:enoyl-CoA hydratase/isomerase family protein [Flocculibacter collagenilyticus]
MDSTIICKTLESVNDKKIGMISLNATKRLNALTHDMIEAISNQLVEWDQDKDVALVVMNSSSDVAFCAGADVKTLAAQVQAGPKYSFTPEVTAFFTAEYKLDYLIHTYSKPLIVWGHGIVMGGGLGLMAGASHRVVTETSKLAMPETTIGLYPDVGASYFFNRMPKSMGLFLGLTGASINAADAKYADLADYFVENDRFGQFIEALLFVKWGGTVALNHQKVSDLLLSFESDSSQHIPASNLKKHSDEIEPLSDMTTASAMVSHILGLKTNDKWLNEAKHKLAGGCPVTSAVVYKLVEQGRKISLPACFKMELGLSLRCAHNGDFVEGVRALLVDKDHQPNWKYKTVHDVPDEEIKQLFDSPWSEADHPLAELT